MLREGCRGVHCFGLPRQRHNLLSQLNSLRGHHQLAKRVSGCSTGAACRNLHQRRSGCGTGIPHLPTPAQAALLLAPRRPCEAPTDTCTVNSRLPAIFRSWKRLLTSEARPSAFAQRPDERRHRRYGTSSMACPAEVKDVPTTDWKAEALKSVRARTTQRPKERTVCALLTCLRSRPLSRLR